MQRLKATASCPSCGAPFELLEGANVARCSYCNLPLLFRSKKNILRYCLKPKVQSRSISFLVDRHRKVEGETLPRRVEEARLFFLPFWRFTTQAFYTTFSQRQLSPFEAILNEEEEPEHILTRDWDVNFPAHTSDDLGIATLGMRPEWLDLRILTDTSRLTREGKVLSLEVNSKKARKSGCQSLNFYLQEKKRGGDKLAFSLIEERLSLIYFPLWIVNFVAPEGKYFHVIDGITGRVLKQGRGSFKQKKGRSSDVETFSPLQIMPHRCPNCGWDLPVSPFHLLFPCTNCSKMWKIEQGGYVEVKGRVAKAREETDLGGTQPSGYFPFWIFEAGLRRKKRSSIEEVFKLLPSEISLFNVRKKSRPFLFYIPAFELPNLKKVGDIALAYVRTQPELVTEAVREENLEGVFISDEDARKIAQLLWLKIISHKANLDLDKWKKLRLRSAGIVWCPCHKGGNFLRDAVVGYSFQKLEERAS
jgi:LSD1 subclass zinc finger protein